MPQCEIVMAARDEAKAVIADYSPDGPWPSIDAKGQTAVSLCSLYGVLEEAEGTLEFEDFEPIAESSERNAWLSLSPQRFVQAVAAIEDPDEIAVLWGEVEGDHARPHDELRSVVWQLRQLCGRAIDDGKCILIWMCM